MSSTASSAERQSRLLALVELVHGVQLALAALLLRESGPADGRASGVLALASLAMLVAFGLLRRRPARSVALYIVVNVVLAPAVILVDSADGAMTSPFMCLAFLTPTILMANALGWPRWTIVSATLALVATAGALLIDGSHAWPDLLHGAIFVSLNLFLVVAFGAHRIGVEAARSSDLRAHDSDLESLRLSLEQRVRRRTRSYSSQNRELQLVLDNVTEGLFTVDEKGMFVSQPSAVLTRVFDLPAKQTSFFEYLGQSDASFVRSSRLAWDQIIAGVLPREVTLAQFPSRLARADRRYDLAIKSVENDAAKFLVVVSDVTDQLEDRAQMRAQAETLTLVRRMLVDRRAFEEFVADASATIERIISHQGDATSQRRDLHTLKGNALLAGLESIADICRELEELALEDEPLDERLLTQLRGAWRKVSSEVRDMVGTNSDEITLTRSQYRALLAEVGADAAGAALYRRLEDLDRQPVEPRLERLKGEAERIARTLDKPVLVTVVDDGVRVAGDGWAPFWAALVHAVRNAVDHGIEPRAERLRSGKGLTGNVWLRARRGSACTVVEVGDDGKGIDWEAVRQGAAAKGRASTSEADLMEAVFQGGISTISTPSEFSGRGVGLGALREATRQLGGKMKVHSVKGQGTLIEMCFDDPQEEDEEPVSGSREHRSALWARDDRAGS